MKCSICGWQIVGFGNNPFPLCSVDDYESRCCDDCNDMVLNARIIQSVKKDETIEVGDHLMIFYAKNSTEPTTMIGEQRKFLSGTVESIDKQNKKIIYKGSWGNFVIDSETDRFIKI